jgi:type II secretory pathway pseudopilin PulG
MVVITIIAILATIALGVMGGLIGQARDAATKSTISKIQGLLNSRSQAFDRLIKRKGYLVGTQEYQWVVQNYGAALPQQSSRQMLATKLLQAKFFPQRYAELYITGNNNFWQKPAGQASIYNNPNAGAIPVLDSSEILYDFLTQSNALGDTPVANDTFSPAEVKDTDNDGLPEFIDAWGNPLRFYRWPTRLFRSQGQDATTGALNAITAQDVSNAQLLFSTLPVFTGNLTFDLARDPQDPLQDCYTIFKNPTNTTTLPPFETVTFPNTSVMMHTPATYHVLLVISAGPDGVLGLYEPYETANNGHLGAVKDASALNDDIVSLSIRAGGK